jgi:hypothetical protein
MLFESAGISGFGSQGSLAGAAWGMVIRSAPGEILKSKPILDLIQLSDVPSNQLLIKGIFVHRGGSVPLVDARVPLSFSLAGKAESACALIVDVEGIQVGLIVGDTGAA